MKRLSIIIIAWALCPALTPLKAQITTTATQSGFHVPSELFTLEIEGTKMFVEHFKDIHYADLTLDRTSAQARVTYAGRIDSVKLSPLSRAGDGKIHIAGNEMRFTLPGQGWWVLEVNGNERLFILANRPEADGAPGRQFVSVLDFGVDTTGTVLQTSILQRALDNASGSGHTLYFPHGVYLTGTLTVHSDTDIYLADGAMIKGSSDRGDYPSDGGRPEADHINNKENYSDNGEFMTFSRLILIDSARNVSIRGRGVIDGSGTSVRAQGKPANLLRIRNSRNVTIEGIILRDPAAWNTHILYSRNVTLREVKLLNDPTVPNTDGFDPDSSKDVDIESCFAYCSDDNVAIKSTGNGGLLQNTEDISVRGCVFLTRKSSLKVGTETKAAVMRRIVFEDNDVIFADRAFALYCNDGARFENIRFINNRVERHWPDSRRRAIDFSIRNRYGKGSMKRILIEDCSFYEAFPRPSTIEGLDDDHTIDRVVLDNVRVAGRKIASPEELQIRKNQFVNEITVK